MHCRDLINSIGGWASVTHNGTMSIRKLYAKIRPQEPKVDWKRIICNNKASPKSLFITWLTLWNWLVTKDRIASWHIPCDSSCFFCVAASESAEHLFFECAYSSSIWNQVLQLLGCHRNAQRLQFEIHWILSHCRRSSPKGRIYIMCFV